MQNLHRSSSDLSTSPSTYIPSALIYEMNNSQPIYYRNYQDVIDGDRQLEEVTGSSYLQSLFISRLIRFLIRHLSDEYEILTNELGLQFAKNSWRSADLAIYTQEQLQDVPIENKYLGIAPKIVIEIDTKADLEDFTSPMGYYSKKTNALLNFGVEKVIWVFTDAKNVMIAEPDQDWIIREWQNPVQIFDDLEIKFSQIIGI